MGEILKNNRNVLSKPDWIKKRLHFAAEHSVKSALRQHGLHTVCEEAHCPNRSECFARGVATVMIMGDVCTRTCKFCNVQSGRPKSLDPTEPENVARWVAENHFKHIVVTSVDRDDLVDFGAEHFAATVKAVRKLNAATSIEVLTPDFQGQTRNIDTVCSAGPQVFNHNLETVERLTPQIRSVARYDRSLFVLDHVRKIYPQILTKSGLMLGLGETHEEILQTMKDLRSAHCQLLTLGQYLQPTKNHWPVIEYVHPNRFKEYEELGRQMGFKAVFAGPFVRSSYLAEEFVNGL